MRLILSPCNYTPLKTDFACNLLPLMIPQASRKPCLDKPKKALEFAVVRATFIEQMCICIKKIDHGDF